MGHYQNGEAKKAQNAIAPLLKHPSASSETFLLAGIIEGQLFDWQKAEALLIKSLALDPKNVDACLSLGNAQHMLGKMQEALISFNRAVEHQPSNAGAWNNLGVVNEDIGHFRKAYDCYEKTLSIDPQHEIAQRSRASVLGRLRWMEKACDAYDQLLIRFPQDQNLIIDYAEFLEQANRPDEVKQLLQKIDEANNKHNEARIELLKGKILKRQGDLSGALQCVTKARKKTGENYLAYTEGQLHDRLGNYKDAMSAFNLANLFRHKQRNFQRLLKQPIQQYLQHKISHPIDSDQAGTIDSHRNIAFITGLPRSGTTLIDRMFDAHPDIQVLEELEGLHMAESVLDDGGTIEQARDTYWQFIESYVDVDSNKMIVDKNPINVLYLDVVPKIFPQAKVILVLRHPYDAALSCFMQDFDAGPVTAQFLNLKSTGKICAQLLQVMYQFEKAQPDRTNRLHYENLVEDFSAEVTRLLAFIGMQWHSDIENYAALAAQSNPIMTASYDQVTKPIYSNAIDRWRNYEDLIKPLRDALAEKLVYFSYTE